MKRIRFLLLLVRRVFSTGKGETELDRMELEKFKEKNLRGVLFDEEWLNREIFIVDYPKQCRHEIRVGQGYSWESKFIEVRSAKLSNRLKSSSPISMATSCNKRPKYL